VTVAYLLHGPNQTNPEELRTLKGIALLLDEAGIAFAACEVELMGDEGSEAPGAR
jgi:hypothetical protein